MPDPNRRRRPLRRFADRLRGHVDRATLVERGLRIGEDAFVDPDVLIDIDFCWLISIGDRATIAPRVTLVAHDASTKRSLGYTRVGIVDIGNDVFVGAGSVVLPGVTIGAGAIVGAGSVVRRDVPPGVVVTGNPAEVRDGVSSYMDRQRQALREASTFDGPGLAPGAGLRNPVNAEIRRVAERDGSAFVE